MKTLKDRIWERRRGVALILGFMVVYMICFTWLENRTGVPIHLLEIRADDYIPFCEYFIIPYFMWFGYIAVTVVYFTLFQDNKQDWWRLILTLGFGMTLFIVVSFVFPNGHTLREYSFPRENTFTKMVRMLYKADTSTNIMPSIHVFNSVACCVAILRSNSLKSRRVLRAGTVVLTVLIIASTMVLKQHTILDVIVALFLNWICRDVMYGYIKMPVSSSWSLEK